MIDSTRLFWNLGKYRQSVDGKTEADTSAILTAISVKSARIAKWEMMPPAASDDDEPMIHSSFAYPKDCEFTPSVILSNDKQRCKRYF